MPTEFKMSPNMSFANKYSIGDKVWVIFTNGPDLRVNEFTVKSFNAEVIGMDEPAYIYGFSIAGDGHEDGLNLTFVQENMIFTDRAHAEKKAITMVGDVMEQYDKQIEKATKDFETYIKTLQTAKNTVSSNNLNVPDRIVKADPETPVETPDNEQSNPESDVETEDTSGAEADNG